MKSFQDGCKKIVDKLTALSYPPTDPQGPDEICTSIDTIYNNRYTSGYNAGVNAATAPRGYWTDSRNNPDSSKYTLWMIVQTHHTGGRNISCQWPASGGYAVPGGGVTEGVEECSYSYLWGPKV